MKFLIDVMRLANNQSNLGFKRSIDFPDVALIGWEEGGREGQVMMAAL